MTTADAITRSLESEDGDNVVDALSILADSARRIANAITPGNAMAGHDAAGGNVASLTEAVMGVTAGLCRIADAILELAQAVEK